LEAAGDVAEETESFFAEFEDAADVNFDGRFLGLLRGAMTAVAAVAAVVFAVVPVPVLMTVRLVVVLLSRLFATLTLLRLVRWFGFRLRCRRLWFGWRLILLFVFVHCALPSMFWADKSVGKRAGSGWAWDTPLQRVSSHAWRH
jgi:hypothetical protein